MIDLMSLCSERGCAHQGLVMSSIAADLQLADLLLPSKIVVQTD